LDHELRCDERADEGIVEEECDEVIYWLELLTDAGIVDKARVTDLLTEANEVLSIVVASIKAPSKVVSFQQSPSSECEPLPVAPPTNPQSQIRNRRDSLLRLSKNVAASPASTPHSVPWSGPILF
jgi:hypothetical protein